jgi:hypothetical protein
MRIIKKRQHHTETTYRLGYQYADSPGSGFSFPCDQDGKVATLSEAGQKNYQACQAGRVQVIRGGQYDRDNNPIAGSGKVFLAEVFCTGIEEDHHSWSTPAVGECNYCSSHVSLGNFTNTCECGCDYNMSGAELVDRALWCEGTDEHLSDILSVDSAVDADSLFDCND